MKHDLNRRAQPQTVLLARSEVMNQNAEYVVIFGIFALVVAVAVLYTALLNQYN